jgi:predicted Zn-dependent protease
MRGSSIPLIALLLLSQCAAIEYERPEPGGAETDAARSAIETADMPTPSDVSVDELVNMVDLAAQRLRSAAPAICAAVQSSTCGFAIRVASDGPAVAFLDRQGTVWITLDLLRHLHNEDEIAVVLAHEIAHRLNGDDIVAISAIRNHQAMRYALGGSSPASAASRLNGSARHAISREMEADYLAAFLVQHAGYDLNAGERAWIVLEKLTDRRAASTLATHPLSAERLASWRKIAAELAADPDMLPALK